jgi:hypothetical protein
METKRRHKFSAPESKGIALTWDDILQVLDGYVYKQWEKVTCIPL